MMQEISNSISAKVQHLAFLFLKDTEIKHKTDTHSVKPGSGSNIALYLVFPIVFSSWTLQCDMESQNTVNVNVKGQCKRIFMLIILAMKTGK